MARPSTELVSIAMAGGGVVIPPDAQYSSAELVSVALALRNAGAGVLVVKGARRYASAELVSIAKAAPGRTLFED